MAIKTRSELAALIANNFPDNTNKLITPAKLREYLNDELDSEVLFDDGYTTLDKTAFDALVAGNGLKAGQWYNITDCPIPNWGDIPLLVLADSNSTLDRNIACATTGIVSGSTIGFLLDGTPESFKGTGNVAYTAAQAITGVSSVAANTEVIITPSYISKSSDDATFVLRENVLNTSTGEFGSLSSDFTTFTPYIPVHSFDITLTDTAAIQAMSGVPIEIVADDGVSVYQLISATIVMNDTGTTNYDFSGYLFLSVGSGNNPVALTADWDLVSGTGALTPAKILANGRGVYNLTNISRGDNNTGGIFLAAQGADATEGDRAIRVYGTYKKFTL